MINNIHVNGVDIFFHIIYENIINEKKKKNC